MSSAFSPAASVLSRSQICLQLTPASTSNRVRSVAMSVQFPELPLMITENGAAFDGDEVIEGRVHDPERVDYLRRHFTAAHRAMQRGVDLRGYQVWSLLDNFEWAYGYTKRFDIVHVDYDTQVRTPKDSAHWYSELIRTRRIPE